MPDQSSEKQKPSKPKTDTAWKRDEWYFRSEEFYDKCYANSVCRYCGKAINTKMDICNCAGMLAARARFQALIRGTPPKPEVKPIFYNPNAFTEQEDCL